jgi:hypothetical protein
MIADRSRFRRMDYGVQRRPSAFELLSFASRMAPVTLPRRHASLFCVNEA